MSGYLQQYRNCLKSNMQGNFKKHTGAGQQGIGDLWDNFKWLHTCICKTQRREVAESKDFET